MAQRNRFVTSSYAAKIASIDLNPVMVGAAGKGAVIVDALVERAVTMARGVD